MSSNEYESYPFERFSREYEAERLKKEFKDYLLVKEIAGTLRGMPHGSLVKSELVVDTGVLVEVSKETLRESDETEEHRETVLIHRTPNNDIEKIEINCTCGRLIVLQFDEEASDDVPPPIEEEQNADPYDLHSYASPHDVYEGQIEADRLEAKRKEEMHPEVLRAKKIFGAE
jgi:hypothetical protein